MAYEQLRREMMLGQEGSQRDRSPSPIRRLLAETVRLEIPSNGRKAFLTKNSRKTNDDHIEWNENQLLALCIAFDHFNSRHRADLYDRFGTGTRWRKTVDLLLKHGLKTSEGSCRYRYKTIMENCQKTEQKMNASGMSSDYEMWYYSTFKEFFLKHNDTATEQRRYFADNKCLFPPTLPSETLETEDVDISKLSAHDASSKIPTSSKLFENSPLATTQLAEVACAPSTSIPQTLTVFPLRRRTDLYVLPRGRSRNTKKSIPLPLHSFLNETSALNSLAKKEYNKTMCNDAIENELSIDNVNCPPTVPPISVRVNSGPSLTLDDIRSSKLSPANNSARSDSDASIELMASANVSMPAPKSRNEKPFSSQAAEKKANSVSSSAANATEPAEKIDDDLLILMEELLSYTVAASPGESTETLLFKTTAQKEGVACTAQTMRASVGMDPSSEIGSTEISIHRLRDPFEITCKQFAHSLASDCVREALSEVKALFAVKETKLSAVGLSEAFSNDNESCVCRRTLPIDVGHQLWSIIARATLDCCQSILADIATKLLFPPQDSTSSPSKISPQDILDIETADHSANSSFSDGENDTAPEQILYDESEWDLPTNLMLAPSRLFANADRTQNHNKRIRVEPKFQGDRAHDRTIRTLRAGHVIGFKTDYLRSLGGGNKIYDQSPTMLIVVTKYTNTHCEGYTRRCEKFSGLSRRQSLGFVTNLDEFGTFDIHGSSLSIGDSLIKATDVYSEQPDKVTQYRLFFATDTQLFVKTQKRLDGICIMDVLDMRSYNALNHNKRVCGLMAPVSAAKRMYTFAEMKNSLKKQKGQNCTSKNTAMPLNVLQRTQSTPPSAHRFPARAAPTCSGSFSDRPPSKAHSLGRTSPVVTEPSRQCLNASTEHDRFGAHLIRGEVLFHLTSSTKTSCHTFLSAKGETLRMDTVPIGSIYFPISNVAASNESREKFPMNSSVSVVEEDKELVGLLRNVVLGLALIQTSVGSFKVVLEKDLQFCNNEISALLEKLNEEQKTRRTDDNEPVLIPSQSLTTRRLKDAIEQNVNAPAKTTGATLPRKRPVGKLSTGGDVSGTAKRDKPKNKSFQNESHNVSVDEDSENDCDPHPPSPKRPRNPTVGQADIDADARIRSLILSFEQIQEDNKTDRAKADARLTHLRQEANERIQRLISVLERKSNGNQTSLMNRMDRLEAKVSEVLKKIVPTDDGVQL